jgi:hypothetical protein
MQLTKVLLEKDDIQSQFFRLSSERLVCLILSIRHALSFTLRIELNVFLLFSFSPHPALQQSGQSHDGQERIVLELRLKLSEAEKQCLSLDTEVRKLRGLCHMMRRCFFFLPDTNKTPITRSYDHGVLIGSCHL